MPPVLRLKGATARRRGPLVEVELTFTHGRPVRFLAEPAWMQAFGSFAFELRPLGPCSRCGLEVFAGPDGEVEDRDGVSACKRGGAHEPPPSSEA